MHKQNNRNSQNGFTFHEDFIIYVFFFIIHKITKVEFNSFYISLPLCLFLSLSLDFELNMLFLSTS